MTKENYDYERPFEKTEIHRVLKLIGEHTPLGRKKLAEKMNLGEGRIRTILNYLKKQKLAKSTQNGHILTESGEKRLREMSERILKIDAKTLTVGQKDVATIARNTSDKVRLGVEERDEAIKKGAEGATVLIYKDGRFRLPKSTADIPTTLESKLRSYFKPNEGDVIIIGTAENYFDAEKGALAAANRLTENQ